VTILALRGTNALAVRLVCVSRSKLVAILIVEDELLLRMDISDDLERHGYEVLQATNADDAIKVLEARDDIRTIFTDIDLPGSTDGLKLAAAVRHRWPPINIIITTGMKAPHADDMPVRSLFVGKPYQNPQVLKAIRSFG
jgi:CheY-like chemotaxis protein